MLNLLAPRHEVEYPVGQVLLISGTATADTGAPANATVYYEWQRSEYETALPYRYERVGLDAGYRVSRTVTLLGQYGKESDLDASTTQGGLDSEFWDAGLRWVAVIGLAVGVGELLGLDEMVEIGGRVVPHRLQVEQRGRGRLQVLRIGHDHPRQARLRPGLVEIERGRHVLVLQQLHDRPGHPLRERAVGHARVGAVQVARLGARERLVGLRVRMPIDRRVRRALVCGPGPPGAVQKAALPGRRRQHDRRRARALGIHVGDGGVVRVRHDNQPALLHAGALDEHDGGHDAGNLVAVRAAEGRARPAPGRPAPRQRPGTPVERRLAPGYARTYQFDPAPGRHARMLPSTPPARTRSTGRTWTRSHPIGLHAMESMPAVFERLVARLEPVVWTPVDADPPFDVVLAGVGHPKDANLYQASRGPTYLHFAPTTVVKPGGTYIVPAPCQEGAGEGAGEQRFYHALKGAISMPDLVAELGGIQRQAHLVEGHAGLAQQQPRPQRPGRVVLVADDEGEGNHGGYIFGEDGRSATLDGRNCWAK